jgi:hypothetical protein
VCVCIHDAMGALALKVSSNFCSHSRSAASGRSGLCSPRAHVLSPPLTPWRRTSRPRIPPIATRLAGGRRTVKGMLNGRPVMQVKSAMSRPRALRSAHATEHPRCRESGAPHNGGSESRRCQRAAGRRGCPPLASATGHRLRPPPHHAPRSKAGRASLRGTHERDCVPYKSLAQDGHSAVQDVGETVFRKELQDHHSWCDVQALVALMPALPLSRTIATRARHGEGRRGRQCREQPASRRAPGDWACTAVGVRSGNMSIHGVSAGVFEPAQNVAAFECISALSLASGACDHCARAVCALAHVRVCAHRIIPCL